MICASVRPTTKFGGSKHISIVEGREQGVTGLWFFVVRRTRPARPGSTTNHGRGMNVVAFRTAGGRLFEHRRDSKPKQV